MDLGAIAGTLKNEEVELLALRDKMNTLPAEEITEEVKQQYTEKQSDLLNRINNAFLGMNYDGSGIIFK